MLHDDTDFHMKVCVTLIKDAVYCMVMLVVNGM